jgi:integrase
VLSYQIAEYSYRWREEYIPDIDFYPPIPHPETGKPTTRREFLTLYLYDKAKTSADKLHNINTKDLAENIRAKRQIAVQNCEYGFLSDYKRQACFIEYFQNLANKRKSSNYDNWISALHHMKDYVGETMKISSLDLNFCEDFREYLLSAPNRKDKDKTIAQNTALSYFNKFKTALGLLYDEGLLKEDLKAKVDSIEEEETQREFLYLEELQTLAITDCPPALLIVKKAALFSALTGLRHSDIKKLVWEEIRYEEGEGYAIHFRQKKTNGMEVLPISDDAHNLLGKRKGKGDMVFEGLVYLK